MRRGTRRAQNGHHPSITKVANISQNKYFKKRANEGNDDENGKNKESKKPTEYD